MKKIYYLVLSVCFLAACESDTIKTDLTSLIVDYQQQSNTRTYDEALSIASSSLSFFPTTRSGVNKMIDETNSFVIMNDNKTRSSISSLDTLFYVFNFTDDNGFAVVSANSSSDGLIAIAEEGNYQTSISVNPAFSFMMERAKEYVNRGGITPFLEPIDTTVIQTIGARINVAWGQRYPLGVLFNNGIAGCTNTAIAQIMTYYMYPSSIVYFENGTSETVNLNWSDIKKHKRTYNDTCLVCMADSATHVSISKLVRQIGLWNQSDDTTSVSGTSTMVTKQFYSLDSLGYNYTNMDYYTTGTAVLQLNGNRLLLMCGKTEPEGGSGHSWVVDGYTKLRITYLSHATPEGMIVIKDKTYNHVNWGWDGIANGFFLDGIFDITDELSYDYSLSFNASYNFKYKIGYTAIYH